MNLFRYVMKEQNNMAAEEARKHDRILNPSQLANGMDNDINARYFLSRKLFAN